jgi:hypothetical protein
MIPQLNLRVQKFLDGETLSGGAIVQVRSLTESGGSKSTQRIPVPVGDDRSRHSVLSVDPGTYEVSTILPSGESISRIIKVTDGDEMIDATLDAGPSPHEWLSWQQWSGNLEASHFSEPGRSDRATILEKVSRDADAEISVLQIHSHSVAVRETVWDKLSRRLSRLDYKNSINGRNLFPEDATKVEVSQRVEAPDIVIQLPFGRGFLQADDNRAYLVVTIHDRSMLCVMPWPWLQVMDHKEALVEALITPATDDSKWSVRTIVRDEMFAGLLGYFAAGEQGIARELIGQAKKLLFYKMENPLAAAAGAYILVGEWIGDSAKGEAGLDWMGWIKNLSKFHPWLPDGKILEGWLELRIRGREPGLDNARSALLEAERRGIPIYTAGVRRLVDGLMLITSEAQRRGAPDLEAEDALGRVRRLAWQIDPSQPFTCVRLWS